MTINPIGEPIPRGVIADPALDTASDAQEAVSQSGLYAWNELADIGLSLAFLPALAWANFVTTSTAAWQSWALPDLQSGAPPVSKLSPVESRPLSS
nr:hypothetical protein [uncultured Shinella sp.]